MTEAQAAPLKMSAAEFPCADQTDEQREAFFRSLKPGDLVPLRDTRNGTLRYTSLPVVAVSPDNTKFFTAAAAGHGSNAWHSKSGKNVDAPTGQVRAVAATGPVVKWAKTGRTAEVESGVKVVVVRADQRSDESVATQVARQVEGLTPEEMKRSYLATAARLSAASAKGDGSAQASRHRLEMRDGLAGLKAVMKEAGVTVPTPRPADRAAPAKAKSQGAER